MRIQSIKPKKQRKALNNARNHQVSKLFTVPLSSELKEEWGINRLPLRVGDSVRVMKGEFIAIEGKVLNKNKKNRRIQIEECMIEKTDGSEYYVPIHVSNVMLTQFKETKKMDASRINMMERKQKIGSVKEDIEEVKGKKANN